MTHKIKSPPALGLAGLSHRVVGFGGSRHEENNSSQTRTQGAQACPLFNPRTREQALQSATACNEAAKRNRALARTHPGATGLTLDRLAVHYTHLARDFFQRADNLPSIGGAA